MKSLRKIMALLIAMVMVLGMSVSVFAANTYTVDAPSEQDVVTGHTYKAYKILAADSIDSDGKLGNVTWADGVSDTAKAALLGNSTDLKALLETLKNAENDSDTATNLAKTAYKNKDGLADFGNITSGTTKLGIGYYLIVDETTANVDVINWANLYVSDGSTPVAVVSKVDAPESDKKVKDTNDSEANSTTEWQKSSDYDIGDKVPFQLTATLPGNYTSYSTYHLTFHDKESAGLTFVPASVKVYVGADSTEPVASTNYTVKTENIGEDTFQVVFDFDGLNAMGVTNSSVIRVEYESTLNTNAEVGLLGNPNTSWITYDNNPNSEQKGEEGGKTPDKTAIVFTYKVVVDKTDGATKQPLAGAEFTLTKKIAGGDDVVVTVVKSEEGTNFTFNGLDDGTYVLSETKTPTGYNTIPDYEFKVVATHTADNGTSAALTNLNGEKISGEVDLTFTKSLENGSLTSTVENNKGGTLPSTGGMGTTLFYIVGGILVAGAAIILIAKRKVNA